MFVLCIIHFVRLIQNWEIPHKILVLYYIKVKKKEKEKGRKRSYGEKEGEEEGDILRGSMAMISRNCTVTSSPQVHLLSPP